MSDSIKNCERCALVKRRKSERLSCMNKQRYSHYVMKKISEGESDIRKGKTLSHEEVGRRLMKLLEKAEDDIAKKQTRPMKIFLKEFKARYRISEKK